jgi:hypothetical protein
MPNCSFEETIFVNIFRIIPLELRHYQRYLAARIFKYTYLEGEKIGQIFGN